MMLLIINMYCKMVKQLQKSSSKRCLNHEEEKNNRTSFIPENEIKCKPIYNESELAGKKEKKE